MRTPLRSWNKYARSASMKASDLESARMSTARQPASGAPRAAPRFGGLGWASRLVLAVATIMALGATSIMVLEGFSRYVLNISYFWAEESVRFLMVWAFFLTLGVAGFRQYHIRTELLVQRLPAAAQRADRKSTRLNSSHVKISYAVFCLIKNT